MSRNIQRREIRFVSKIAVHVHDAYSLIDMMRYDSCFPESENESRKIERLMRRDAKPEDHVIRLTRVASTRDRPSFARWRSFNASVIREWNPDDSGPSDAELIAALKEPLAGLS